MTRLSFLGALLLTSIMGVHAQWTRFTQLPATEFSTVHYTGGSLYSASGNVVFVSTDGGGTWLASAQLHDSVDFVSHMEKVDSRLIAGTYKQGIFESTDGGGSWTQRVTGLTGLGAMDVDELVVRGGDLYLGSGAGVYISPLSGPIQWSQFNDSLPSRYAWTINCLYNDHDTLIAGAGASATMYRNNPGGRVWDEYQFAPFNPLGTTFLAALRIGPYLLGGGSQGLYRSRDGGRTWDHYVNPGIGSISDANFAAAPSAIFVNLGKAGSSYLFFSQDSGASWTQTDGSPVPLTYKIEISGTDLLAARIDGLWWRPTSVTTLKQELPLPASLSLGQNFPNPFNPSTRVAFSLPARMHISLAVYDLLGRLVARLSEGYQEAGNHEVSWHAEGLAGGMYVCRLQANGAVHSRRMLLLK